MSYNWKCCSFYPNNFDASALCVCVDIYYIGTRVFIVIYAVV